MNKANRKVYDPSDIEKDGFMNGSQVVILNVEG